MTDLVSRTIVILRLNGGRWGELTSLDGELLRRQPKPGEWSALECLNHAADTESRVFAARVRAILAGEDLRPYDPDVEATSVTVATDPAEVAARHASHRAESLALLAGVTDADLDRTARHPELGVVSLRELLNEWSAHDLMHLVQAERALMQTFIPGSGPWRGYFADHDVDLAATRPGD